ncbi:hypothetical protein OROGR_031765 [Orobanche gracilis]
MAKVFTLILVALVAVLVAQIAGSVSYVARGEGLNIPTMSAPGTESPTKTDFEDQKYYNRCWIDCQGLNCTDIKAKCSEICPYNCSNKKKCDTACNSCDGIHQGECLGFCKKYPSSLSQCSPPPHADQDKNEVGGPRRR